MCVCACVILSAFSRCPLPPFGDPPASLITRYLGNSGLPRVCASVTVSVCVCVGGCLSVNYDSSCSVQSGYPHTPVWGTPTHICCLPVCLSYPFLSSVSGVSPSSPRFQLFPFPLRTSVRMIMAVGSSNADLLLFSSSAVCSEQVRNTLIRTSSHEHRYETKKRAPPTEMLWNF